ncbi:hypothetical protein AC249_AIPGENE13966 [Exaiptasia diaphana]|nr:hypothetical protein AC249_AIPGENE13966 [Exaiptasia diaphana]
MIVLLNCSTLLPWEQTVTHINQMVARMQYTGYKEEFRYDVVKSALNAYRRILALDKQGLRPMYRPKEWKKAERDEKKREKRTSWYKRGIYSSVIFIPATPNSELRKILEEDVRKSGVGIKIVEKSETNVKRVLQRSNPFRKKVCEEEECLVCRTGATGPCRTQGITYEIECKSCKDKYISETSRNAFTREREHVRSVDSNTREHSVLKRHCSEKHGGILQDFVMNVTGTYNQDRMLRQITESVRIKREGRSMNTKTEWNTVLIPRANIELS